MDHDESSTQLHRAINALTAILILKMIEFDFFVLFKNFLERTVKALRNNNLTFIVSES